MTLIERMQREAAQIRSNREKAEYYAQPENLVEFARDLLDLELHPNQVAWHELMIEHRKLLIEAAVGHGKSTWLYPEVTQFICRTMMELYTGQSEVVPRVLFVTGRSDLAEDYGSRVQRGLLSDKVQELYGAYGIGKGQPWSVLEFRVSGMPVHIKEPTWRASGPTGGIEGTRSNYGILDDFVDIQNALSPADRNRTWMWYGTTFIARMDKGARVVVIGSSWHPEDAYSKIRASGGFADYKFPCYGEYEWGELLSESLKSRTDLEEMREDMGDTIFRLRLMMDHEAMMGGFFDESWIEYIDEEPVGMEKQQAWDLAITEKEIADAKKTDPDYTAGVTLGFDPRDGKLVFVDLVHKRITRDHDLHIKNFWTKHGKPSQVGIETNAFQKLLMHLLNQNAPEVPAVGVEHYEKKVTRLLALQPYYQRGWKVVRSLVDSNPEAWLAFLLEYRTFPHGNHDDILDAKELCLSLMKKGQSTLLEGFDDW